MSLIEVKVPDIGDFKDVPIIEVHVKPGDVIGREAPLITLESDKAAMEVPAPSAGRVAELLVKVGDKVSEGSAILRLVPDGDEHVEQQTPSNDATVAAPVATDEPQTARRGGPTSDARRGQHAAATAGTELPLPVDFGGVHASPSVRRLARELDIDLTRLTGTGEKGRITKDDVKRALAGAVSASGIPEIPPQDFAKFGPVEVRPLSRLKRLSGPHLHRAWLNVPHVTHCDEADITDLEGYRKTLDAAARDKGYRVTLLAFLVKASVVALKDHPDLNASLSADRQSLIVKRYFNIGVAVDTAEGLVVPVIKDADRKGLLELSQELGSVSARMRDGKITPSDIQGGTFSISSLGGIGGTSFSPIVNAPEVAILGVVKALMKPRWNGNSFDARLMLPLCLSYDHRVVDGALAARFTRRLAEILGDVRLMVL